MCCMCGLERQGRCHIVTVTFTFLNQNSESWTPAPTVISNMDESSTYELQKRLDIVLEVDIPILLTCTIDAKPLIG